MFQKLYRFGLSAYAVMFALSILFYKERMFFLDTAYNLFHMARSGRMFLHATREGAFFTQLLPFAGIKAGAPLEVVAMLYSIGFVLYFSTCYFICGTLLRRPDFALVILLSSIISIAHTFYYTPSELPQGIAFVMVVFAYVSSKASDNKILSRSGWCVFLGGIVASAFFHPLMIFIVGYALGYFYLNNASPIARKIIIVAAVVFISTTVYKTLFMRLEYDGHSMSGLKNIVKLFPNYLNLYSNKLLLSEGIKTYYWLPILFTVVVAFYINRKQLVNAFYFIFSFVGYLFIVNVSFPDAATPIFYRENLLLPLTFFIAVPLVFDILPALHNRRITVSAFLMIITTGCLRIYTTNGFYTDRLNWQRRFMADKLNNKLLIDARNVPMEKLMLAWGTSFEFYLIGECEHNKTVSLLIDEKPDRFSWAVNDSKAFFTTWQVYHYSELPSKYFHFEDTVIGYRIIR